MPPVQFRSTRRGSLALLIASALALPACADATAPSDTRGYGLHFAAHFLPDVGAADVTIKVAQSSGRLRVVDLNAPADRYEAFTADGSTERQGDRVIWRVPQQGGALRYRAHIDSRRGEAYDAHITERWAILRMDDLFPPAKVRSLRGSGAEATLELSGPPGWSFETGYGSLNAPRAFANAERRFDRPVGWLVAGELGVRRDRIAGRRVAVAAPVGETLRRQDVLAFLRWTLPELASVLPSLPERLLIAGGGRDMWRGALSAPNSLYLHPDRPLLSENATSTLLHELVHVATVSSPAAGDDWIAEGLAEYYSLTVLVRSGGISRKRYEQALATLTDWARRDRGTLADPSTGANTAFATLLFRDLDLELSAAGSSLDRVAGALLGGTDTSRQRLRELVEAELDGPSSVLGRVAQAEEG